MTTRVELPILSATTPKVKVKLLNDPVVSGLSINVESFKGAVQMSGFANSDLVGVEHGYNAIVE